MVLRGGTFSSQTVEAVKNLPASEGDARDSNLITGLGRCLGEGNDNTLQYSCWDDLIEECGGLQSMGSQRVGHD